jgi:ABC-type nitrate/sulfonate/bicarbonate transport system substrate-binding protein
MIKMISLGAVGLGAIPLAIAHQQGLFRRHGVDVELVLVPGTEVPQVTTEKPVGYIGAPAAVMRAAEGTDLKILASFDSGRLSNHLVAGPDIKTPADLCGKRLGARVKGAALWIQSVLALEQLGLDPERDNIDILEIGDPPQIGRALEAGNIDAAVLSRAQSGELRAKGYSILLDLYPCNVYGAQDALITTAAFLEQNPAGVGRIISAMIEATAFCLSTRGEVTVLRTVMAELKVLDDAAAKDSLDQLSLILKRKPYPSLRRLQNMQRIMSLHRPSVLEVDIRKLIDDRFVQELETSGFIDSIYRRYEVRAEQSEIDDGAPGDAVASRPVD